MGGIRVTDQSEIHPGIFWTALGERPIGMTLVTATGADGPVGFVGLSAAHVTAKPATMLASIDRGTSALDPILKAGAFAINALAKDQESIAAPFMPKGDREARFKSEGWATLVTGAPIFEPALCVFDCTLVKTVEIGATVIVIGEVMGLTAKGEGEPLVFFRGGYGV